MSKSDIKQLEVPEYVIDHMIGEVKFLQEIVDLEKEENALLYERLINLERILLRVSEGQ